MVYIEYLRLVGSEWMGGKFAHTSKRCAGTFSNDVMIRETNFDQESKASDIIN